MTRPGILSLVFLAALIAGLPWLAARSHRGGRLLAVPRLPLYLSAALSQWLLAALLGGVLWRDGWSLAALGLDRQLGLAATLGWAALTTALGLAITLATRALRVARGSRESAEVEHVLPRSAGERRAFALLVAPTAGLVEELLFRGFAVAALLGLGLAPLAAAVATSVAFALSHLYQGALGVARVAALGLVLALPRLVTGSLWPAILAHTALDIVLGLWLGRWLIGPLGPAQTPVVAELPDSAP